MFSNIAYRNWCPHCISGRGKNVPHRKRQSVSYSVPYVVIDDGLWSADGEERSIILQIAQGLESGFVFAQDIPWNGLVINAVLTF